MELSSARVLEVVRACLDEQQLASSLVCWDRRVLKEGESVGPAASFIHAPFESTLVFVDLAPSRNWAHPALYLFIDPGTGRYATEDASFPPYLSEPPRSYVVLLRQGAEPSDERDFGLEAGSSKEV